MSKLKIDKKKIYLYATPLAFVFGIVFGTLFIAYVVIAQSYFNANNFVFEGGTIQNAGGAPTALMIPQGTVAVGTTSPNKAYNLHIVGDILGENSSLTLDAITVETTTLRSLKSYQDADIDVNGHLKLNGGATFTSGPFMFEKTQTISGQTHTVNIDFQDLFEIIPGSAQKIWIDGNNYEWGSGRVYNSSKTDVTTDCSGTSNTSATGYKVITESLPGGPVDRWAHFDCVNDPYPPDENGNCIAF